MCSTTLTEEDVEAERDALYYIYISFRFLG